MTLRYGTALLGLTSLWFMAAKPYEGCRAFIAKAPFRAAHSHMFLLKKKDGSQWLIKQRKKNILSEQFQCVTEVIGHRMAQFLNIPCNSVELVPWDACRRYKYFKNYPATLHSRMPGASGCVYRPSIKLYQDSGSRCAKTPTCGLRLQTIKGMANHPTLPLIAALDTFMAGADRSCGNMLYDRAMDTFYGIDFSCGFSKNLANAALQNLKQLAYDGTIFTDIELAALKAYRNALERLVNTYPPEVLYAALKQVAYKAGFFSTRLLKLWKPELRRHLARCKKSIASSHASTIALINYLKKMQR